jgi:hypothetical protein
MVPARPGPAASGAPQLVASAAASSGAEYTTNGQPSPSGDGRSSVDLGTASRPSLNPSVAGPVAGGAKSDGSPSYDLLGGTAASQDNAVRPTNVLFGAAVLVGIGLLILSRRRGRGPA